MAMRSYVLKKISDKSCDTAYGNHRFLFFLQVFVLKHQFFFMLSPPEVWAVGTNTLFHTKGSFRMFLPFEPRLEQPVLSHLCKLHFVLLGFREQGGFLCKAIEDMCKCKGVPWSTFPEILGRRSLLIWHIFPAAPVHFFAQASS